MSYLVIDLTVRKASMLQSLGLLAPAPVLPAVLLAHALDKRLPGTPARVDLGVKGVGLIHHDSTPWVEFIESDTGFVNTHLVQQRGACLFDRADISRRATTPQSHSAQPMALADLSWTLVLDCARQVPQDIARNIEDLLCRMRLAGGRIESADVFVYEEWSLAVRNALRSGHWIEDATFDLLGQGAPGNPLQALLRAIAERKEGWLAPVNLGYALLEPPQPERDGARDGFAHAFAENLVGAIRYVPAGVARRRDTLTPAALWRSGWVDDQFLVTNNPSVSLNPAQPT